MQKLFLGISTPELQSMWYFLFSNLEGHGFKLNFYDTIYRIPGVAPRMADTIYRIPGVAPRMADTIYPAVAAHADIVVQCRVLVKNVSRAGRAQTLSGLHDNVIKPKICRLPHCGNFFNIVKLSILHRKCIANKRHWALMAHCLLKRYRSFKGLKFALVDCFDAKHLSHVQHYTRTVEWNTTSEKWHSSTM